MGFIHDLKIKAFHHSVEKAMTNAEMRGLEVFWFHGVVTDQIPMINGYYADKYTPEETILEILNWQVDLIDASGTDVSGAFGEFPHHIFAPIFKPDWGKALCDLAHIWRSEGKVRKTILEKLTKNIDRARKRFPQTFNGEEPFVDKYWELHFDINPLMQWRLESSVDEHLDPTKKFITFSDAINYVEKHAKTPLWWHQFDLHELAKKNEIPSWKETKTPNKYVCMENPDRVVDSSEPKYIFAMPEQTYKNFLQAVKKGDMIRENKVEKDEYGNDQTINYIEDVDVWCIRYVEVEKPIDNDEPLEIINP